MAKPLLTDELWQEIAPLLPPPKPRRFHFPGRKPVDNRKVLIGILFVLKTGIPWEALPQEMGCGSGMTCWRRLYEWQKAGVWGKVHALLLEKVPGADKIDWARTAVGRTVARVPQGRQKLVPADLPEREKPNLPQPQYASSLADAPANQQHYARFTTLC